MTRTPIKASASPQVGDYVTASGTPRLAARTGRVARVTASEIWVVFDGVAGERWFAPGELTVTRMSASLRAA